MSHDGPVGHGTPSGDTDTRARTVADLQSRLEAVERAISDGEPTAPASIADAAEPAGDGRSGSARLGDLDERVAELESAMQAIRGYVGAVRAVNERVERRADRALAVAERQQREPEPSVTGVRDARDTRDLGAAARSNLRPSAWADDRSERDGGTHRPEGDQRNDQHNGNLDEATAEQPDERRAQRGDGHGDDDSGCETPIIDRLRDAL